MEMPRLGQSRTRIQLLETDDAMVLQATDNNARIYNIESLINGFVHVDVTRMAIT